jgi:diacylglycerol O-acyltransferase / wax synthase
MKRMSGVDAAFWTASPPAWHTQMGTVAIHETADAPDFSLEAVWKSRDQTGPPKVWWPTTGRS